MAACRSNTKLKQSLKGIPLCANKDCSCANCLRGSSDRTQRAEITILPSEGITERNTSKQQSTSVISLRSSNRGKADLQPLPNVEATGPSPTTHSNMKTKQTKEESDKSIDEDTVAEPKTRARKKASDLNEDDKNKSSQEEPKTSKDTKKPVNKPKTVVRKRPLGIRKTLRGKKPVLTRDKIKTIVKQTAKRGRKAAVKPDPDSEKATVPLIPASEIKKEPIEETASNSRSSSPRTAGRRQRLSSDMIMMKSVLGDSPNNLVLGPRTSPYSMRSERSNSPLLADAKNLRSGKPRKVKNNLLNEVVMKEQKKRRRLLSDSKTTEVSESTEDCKKLKRGRSCSRDGSEISKGSDVTESDISMSEPFNDTDSKELNKKLDKSKTDLDIDIENNVQISTTEKVPSLNVDSNLAETKQDAETSCITNKKTKEKLSLKRSTSLDSDNNNSNRVKLNSSDIEEKLLKTENDTLFEARSSILTSMSKTFNSKEVSKNIRKARKGRKAMAAARSNSNTNVSPVKASTTSTITNDPADDKAETIETLSKEIDDLINDLDQHIDQDHEEIATSTHTENSPDQMQAKPVSKFYGLSKPLGDNNSILTPDTPLKDKETIIPISNETTPSKTDDSENIRLHYEEDSAEKSTDGTKIEIAFKCKPVVASIDKLMDRLKEFEEFDKKRQRQESESKSCENKPMMVTNDVVLITKSGADIKPLKDIQSVRSPERPIEKENVLSCFENNSAISIVKRDSVRKSTDVDLPNSVTLIKRNSISARKESTSSNHSKESDAISIFEKSLGKDVTLTEIRKSVDKSAPTTQVDLLQFATLQPSTPNQSLAGVVLDSNQISILPRVVSDKMNSSNDIQIITKHKSRESLSNKSSDAVTDTSEEKATLEKIKSPQHQISSAAISIIPAPIAVKSDEMQPLEAEALPPALVEPKIIPEDTSLTTEVSKTDSIELSNANTTVAEESESTTVLPKSKPQEDKIESIAIKDKPSDTSSVSPTEPMVIDEKPNTTDIKPESVTEDTSKAEEKPSVIPEMLKTPEIAKVVKARSKSARNSIESVPGPSNILHETPESRERKEAVLRTLGLLTHKAAKEAKIEKQKEKERIYNSNKNKASKSGSGDYTGTLKTVIKLNRSTGERDKKKYRSSLKMTFQKSKHRSGKAAPEGEAADEEAAYYTIEKREGGAGATSDGGHRKSHYSNRLNNHDTETAPEPVEPKETLNLVIPEKASSFSIHPGRLCMDQCFYCGGKFGLFDTPCHIAQMKSSERQKKVLDNEEKLTIDSCLCDACYRHVDRRANCPSYRKRPIVKLSADPAAPMLPSPPPATQAEKLSSPPLEEESEEEGAPALAGGRPAACHTAGCGNLADHSIRRKWLIKMRNSVNKVLKLECDYPGLHTIPLCGEHYRSLSPLMACVLCRRRITKHHNVHFIHHGYLELNPLLREASIPVQFTERPLLCKICRCYCTLLQRSGNDDKQAKAYRRKLLEIYNIEVPPDSDNEPADEAAMIQDDANASFAKQKKKQRAKNKQRKSTEPEKDGNSESSERTSPHHDTSPEKGKDDSNDGQKHLTEQKTSQMQPIEEDIESLISSNKILVPGAVKQPETPMQTDEPEDVYDFEAPILDKQTELQYLLQKQNNPAQFLQKPANLTQKQRNIMKLQTAGIQKPGQQHRINEKNAKRIHKLGHIVAHKEKSNKREQELQIFDPDKSQDGIPVLKNITLNEECTIETIPNKKPADIATLKNKWQMSESFTQVKKNLSELSKKLSTDKDPKKDSNVKYSNPVKRLETNPSISVRELFPGEEEMNLHCNIDFNNVKGVTPEGWEKCNSTIQYDVETKRLWNELQRPYGNQSSFMRHLILLEKYFRNGDLILAHNATPHAANYSDSVQSRLRAYDNVVSDAPRRSEPATSLMDFRKKPSVNGKSLLKTSQNAEAEKDPKKSMPPPGTFQKPKPPKADKSKSKALPPELIAINTPNAQGRKAIQNVLQNIQQLVKDVSASDPTEVAAAPLPVPKFDSPKFEPPKFEAPKLDTPKVDPSKEKKETPKSDTPKRQKVKSKPWRPTLMPITPENLAKAASEPPQVAVDGRLLPSLVQVKTNQKRYRITLQDYNKMCLIRREKMKLLQDGEQPKSADETTVVTEIQPSAMLGNGGTVVQNIVVEDKSQDKKEMPELGQISSNAATILKNVGLKNITIAPIPPKTATVTSQTFPSPAVSSPSLLVTSLPKLPQLGPSVSITSEAVLTSNLNLPVMSSSHMIMPKIPKSLTVIPQTVVSSLPQTVVSSLPQTAVVPATVAAVTTQSSEPTRP